MPIVSTRATASAQGFGLFKPSTGFRLFIWGDNNAGQIGIGTSGYGNNQLSPVQLGGPVWANLGVGEGHTLAIQTNGTLWAWGTNGTGALGLGDTTDRSSPTQIGSLSTWSQVWGGRDTSFATKTDGTLWAWGANGSGELGFGDTTNRSSPVQVGALANWDGGKMVAMYGSVAFIKPNGTLWAWGRNSSGALGLGDTTDRSSPVQVGALSDWSTLGGGLRAGGSNHVLATRTNGTLWAWGWNGWGQLGLGNTTSYSSPVQVGALTDWAGASITRGINFLGSALIKPNGTLWAMGYNGTGGLGDGTSTSRSSPVQIGALTTWATEGARNIAAMQGGWGAAQTSGLLWGPGANITSPANRTNCFHLNFGATFSSPIQVGSYAAWAVVEAGSRRAVGLLR